jgi:hypothetical protein
MSFQPFKSEKDLTQYAARFFRDRVQSFRKDIGICLTANADGHHAYFPALITCIGFLDFLSGLNAGKLEGHGLTELHLRLRIAPGHKHKKTTFVPSLRIPTSAFQASDRAQSCSQRPGVGINDRKLA